MYTPNQASLNTLVRPVADAPTGRPSQIPMGLSRLKESSEALTKRLYELRERLTPVMHPGAEGSQGSGIKTSDQLAPMAESIDEIFTNVCACHDLLADIFSRLEI